MNDILEEDLNKVYAVLHTDCIYESAYYVVSLHKTKKGAVKGMKKFKEILFNDPMHSLSFDGFKYSTYKLQE